MPVTATRRLTRRCVLCRLDKPAAMCMDVNSDRGALVWVCRRCWHRHTSQAEQMGMRNKYWLLREKLTRLAPYETHTVRGEREAIEPARS
jgi:hypothetical protein